MPRQRLGVVLLLPPPVAIEIDALRKAVGADNIEQLAPHLTLVPPVNVRDDDLDAALDLLRDAAQRTRPFTLTLGPARTFLPTNPVLFLDVGGDVAAVDALRDKVFRPPLERTLTWPFQPHVTLLDTGDEAHIRAAETAFAAYRAHVTIERIHLLRERNSDGVRFWDPIAEAAFGEPAVVGRGGLELELEVGERLWSEPDDGRPLAITARRGGRIVGTATGVVRPTGEASLHRLVVAADVHGEGIGSHLLAAFVSAATERSATHLTVRSVAGSPEDAFYRRHGFGEWADPNVTSLRRDL